MSRLFSKILKLACGLTLSASGVLALAAYPDKPIKMVVAYPPGGSTDVIARALAGKLSERLKQAVVVDNRPGASGMIGSEFVAGAAPDGYTIMFTAADTHSINPHVYSKMRYDAKRDFAPVSLVGFLTMALIVNPNKPSGSLLQYMDAAKSKPGTFSYASWGTGSSSHVAMEMFRSAAGLGLIHVPFQGAAPAITAVIGGQVDSMMVPMTLAEPNHRAGKVKLLGVAAPARVSWATDLPTLAEQGVALDGRLWLGVLAPAKVPADIVALINREINAVLADPAMKETMLRNGLEAAGGSAQSFSSYLDAEFGRWGSTISGAKIRID
jgi:tripartite-type tricarboxylate transporter receptor subunit TctC